MFKKEYIAHYQPISTVNCEPIDKLILAWDLEDAYAKAERITDPNFTLASVQLVIWQSAKRFS